MEKKNFALILGKAAEKVSEKLSFGLEEGEVIKNIEEHTDESFERAKEAETEDPCATPEGYTDESWREHMGHHPDQYKDCL
jgi:hypothetical protein